ncbi:hypothetical protein [Phaeocystidibacter luteus]|uniref:Uncharacterized protein n=1 Tax=Phaeocystidibacter luteus TaxID=911197 RepID=A0A6N6RJ73_9FLAO|nr:hypothetical protein [Phaeocystidibacter luteus]KAB2813684.1 hypothetical protein F8C67_05855 [Phaeocystidibacter luteus]
MRIILCISFLIASLSSIAQVQREDGTWYDENLAIRVMEEDIRNEGTLEICIYSTTNDRCIHNLKTPYEVLVYNEDGEQIWNSAWTGQKMSIKFSTPLRGAAYIVVNAKNDYVVNTLTGERIFTNGVMSVEYEIE